MQNNKFRRITSITIFSLSVLTIAYLLISGRFILGFAPDDFIAYWSSGRLISMGIDPYSQIGTMQLTEELGLGKSGFYLSYFYPPWTLPLFIPFGLLSFPISRTIWFILSLIIYTSCALWIWKLYDGPAKKIWFIIPCIIFVVPGIFALLEGQVTPLILAGLIGFLHFEKKGKWFLAGVCLALITFKFHVLYLFWIALFLWIIYKKRWMILIGFMVTLAVSSLLILIIRPSVFMEFFIMNTTILPSYCTSPTISSILCLFNNNDLERWYLLVGPLLGILLLFPFWIRKKDDWQWMDLLPLLIFISLITAPYTWMHDGLLFIIAVISTAILFLYQRPSIRVFSVILLFFIINILIFNLIGELRINQITFIWVAPAYLILYIISNPMHPAFTFRPIEQQ
jgi:hypothetical protein